MLDASVLPEPSADATAISTELGRRVANVIAQSGGTIGFDDYMRMALYEPGLGYYLAGAIKFGADGDFVTAPELSPLFGLSIARCGREILERTAGAVLEFGAGSGALAASALNGFADAGCPPSAYTIVELSPDLRERQRATIAERAPAALDRVRWIAGLPDEPIDGLVIANEIVDALPVRVFRLDDGAVLERRVGQSDGGFDWVDELCDPAFEQLVRARVGPGCFTSGEPYTSEINCGADPWVNDLARTLRRGVALVIDYGYPRAEYYHPTRRAGTLRCHYRHRVLEDPFRFPGLQDITASVDFTQVAEAADGCGLHVAGFTEQTNFLLETGILDHVEALSRGADEGRRQRLAFETKVLTLPTEMGSRFKLLALSHDYPAPIDGFRLRDDRHRL